MEFLQQLWSLTAGSLPFLLTLVLIVAGLALIDRLMRRRETPGAGERHFGRHVTMLALSIVGLIVIILSAPVDSTTRNQLIGLVGVALTAAIALASTTFVSNAMAGILLRAMSRFRPGDFIRVGDHLGRVTERGLFHTEVQTEDRDLATFPNFYLVSNPIKVVRASGTIISATVSLGYDVQHRAVSAALGSAAEAAGLKDPFVHVLDLGDFSVTYRVAGFLEDVKQLVTAQSRLRVEMLDGLHAADIEIVSPTFMTQRRQPEDVRVMARPERSSTVESENAAEEVMFDKAEAAAHLEELKAEREALRADIEQMQEQMASADEAIRPRIERGLRFREQRLETIDAALAAAKDAIKQDA